jgi:hypothetical protein
VAHASFRNGILLSLKRRTFVTRDGMQEINSYLPKNSIVIGSRATTWLRGTDLEIGFGNYNLRQEQFVNWLVQLVNATSKPVYWLVDSDFSPQLDNFRNSIEIGSKPKKLNDMMQSRPSFPF